MNVSQRRENFIPREAKLSFHSLVNPALIPFYARAGPSVELHSSTEETSKWLKSRLLGGIWLGEEDGETFDQFSSFQCPVGLLVGVDLRTSRTYSAPNNVSDLLIYGILSSSHDAKTRPPSPPDSSSVVGDINESKIRRELRIYAVPLAASYVQKVQDLPSPPSSTAEDDTEVGKDAFAHFLPDLRSPSPKRKRILSLFEGVAQHHRRVRQRGGEAVSQMMANTKSQASSQLSSIRIKREGEEPNSPALEKLELRRARSLSLGGSQLSKIGDNTGMVDKSRPGSSKGMLGRQDSKSKLNKLHTFNGETVHSQSVGLTPSVDFAKSTTLNDTPPKSESQVPLLSSSPPANGEAVVAKNKDLITRTILTCMRLYGYNRKASRSSKPGTTMMTTSEPSQELDSFTEYTAITEEAKQTSSGLVASEEEEFKAMYHATYRAATFALRYYLKIGDVSETMASDNNNSNNHHRMPQILSKDTATNIIDSILKLFCDDNLKPNSG